MSVEGPTGRFWNRTQGMGLAAIIMSASILLSRFVGLVRDKVISYLFGAGIEADVYFASFVIPDFINYLLAGGYFSITLIPLLAHYFERDDEEGWGFFSAVLWWVAAAIVSLTLICMAFSPQLAHWAAPGLPPEAQARLALFLRIILPAQVCFLLGSCFSALLLMRKQFIVPALVPVVYNFFIVTMGVLLRGRGMEGFCWGVLVGAVMGNLLLPYLACRGGEGLSVRFRLQHPGMRQFLWLALPLMVGQSIVVLDEQLVRIFGSMAGVGAVSWLNYARRIMLVPVGVVAQAAGVASYPFLSELYVKNEWDKFQETLGEALRNVLTLLIPMSAWMMLVSEPTVRLIFQQGSFSAQDTRETALLLVILLTAVSFWGVQQILGRAFYARKDTVTPAVIGTLFTCLSIPIFYSLHQYAGAYGVAAASSASLGLYSLALGLWWGRLFGFAAFKGLGRIVLRLMVVVLPAVAAASRIAPFLEPQMNDSPFGCSLIVIVLSGFVYCLVFALVGRFFIQDLIAPFARKLGPFGKFLLP